MKKISDIDSSVLKRVRQGCVIPAQVLALNEDRTFAPKYQRALCRYFIDAGSGGIAVGVHSTQFAIRDPEIGLFETVLKQTGAFIDEWCARTHKKVLKVGGVCGRTDQAVKEASFEAENGYDAALLSLAAFKNDSVETMLDHCREVASVMPLIGFYLQPSVGGRILPIEFWREFVKIENVLAIKMAPFNRYCTLDVVRAVAESGREDITLYTGNDDNLLLDLLTEYKVSGKSLRIKGGLLGH
ncbi:MAG: dihydrodipicolinate synthase family protein, partial [Lentisphaeria bacterium]|nr:dihydrodipicolinate synthase family protein [Lentisphaeria bacterium]